MMGGCLARLGEAVTRKKTVDPPAPGLQRRLTLFDLMTVGLSSTIGVGGYVCVGASASVAETGPSVCLSVLLACVAAILTGLVCVELGLRFPRGGGVYTQVYATLGELPAVLIAATLLLDLTLLPAIAARGTTHYLDAATNNTVSRLMTWPLPDTRYLAPSLDLVAVSLLLLSTLLVMAGTKVVLEVVGVGLVVSALVLIGLTCTAAIDADPTHWTRPPGFIQSGVHGVLCGGAVMSVGVAGMHHAGLLAGECVRYQGVSPRVGVAVGVVALLTLLPLALALTLAHPALATTTTLASLFSDAWVRAVAACGGVVGLWACVVGGLMVGARAWHRLACDGLAPRWLSRASRWLRTPVWAAMLCGGLSSLAAALASFPLLVGLAGSGGLAAGVAGAAGVLARRYRPGLTHPLEGPRQTSSIRRPPTPSDLRRPSTPSDLRRSATPSDLTDLTAALRAYEWCEEDDAGRCVAVVEWRGGAGVTNVVEGPPSWGSWGTARFLVATFVTNCVAGAAVVRVAAAAGVEAWWVWAGVALCGGGCVVCGVGLWLQPRHLPPPLLPYRDLVPLLPLLAILANVTLLLHLPPPSLIVGGGVMAAAAAVWLINGRTGSIEAALNRALLTHPGHESPPDLL